jgi:hypothetical protein
MDPVSEKHIIDIIHSTAKCIPDIWLSMTPDQRYIAIISRFPQVSFYTAMAMANINDLDGFDQLLISKKLINS